MQEAGEPTAPGKTVSTATTPKLKTLTNVSTIINARIRFTLAPSCVRAPFFFHGGNPVPCAPFAGCR